VGSLLSCNPLNHYLQEEEEQQHRRVLIKVLMLNDTAKCKEEDKEPLSQNMFCACNSYMGDSSFLHIQREKLRFPNMGFPKDINGFFSYTSNSVTSIIKIFSDNYQGN